MIRSGPIAFVDSGLGGLPYLFYTKERLPEADYVYCADTKGFPYGTKTEDEIRNTFGAMVEKVAMEAHPSLFVVACNTASTIALGWLRESFDYEFVGVVPAVKPAARDSFTKSIGIIATKRTVEGRYLEHLINTYASDCSIHKRAATELINKIEADPFAVDRPGFISLLEQTRDDMLLAEVDTLVLGCTHFLLISDLFYEVMGSNFRIMDSRDGVSRQTIKLYRGGSMVDELVPNPPHRAKVDFFITGPEDRGGHYRSVVEKLGISYKGIIGDQR